ncbi:MAG: hypothetical protein ACLSTO_07205 [Bilophila wadsworthia]
MQTLITTPGATPGILPRLPACRRREGEQGSSSPAQIDQLGVR